MLGSLKNRRDEAEMVMMKLHQTAGFKLRSAEEKRYKLVKEAMADYTGNMAVLYGENGQLWTHAVDEGDP